jgi:hypothetical protein
MQHLAPPRRLVIFEGIMDSAKSSCMRWQRRRLEKQGIEACAHTGGPPPALSASDGHGRRLLQGVAGPDGGGVCGAAPGALVEVRSGAAG